MALYKKKNVETASTVIAVMCKNHDFTYKQKKKDLEMHFWLS
jgi:hypothetical protein